MGHNNISKFQFIGFQILESKISHVVGKKAKREFQVGFDLKGKIYKEKNLFELFLDVQISEATGPFSAEIKSLGKFHFDKKLEMRELSNYFYINAPAILFPYIRAYISSLTALSGGETVTLPTINLTALGE